MSILRRGLKNTGILTLSTGINQLLAFITFLIIPKELGPANYGLLSIGFTLLSFFDILASSGLNKVLIRQGCESINNIERAFRETFGLKLILLLLAIVLSGAISIFYYNDLNLFLIVILMGFEFSFTALFRYFGSYFIIVEDFLTVSIVSTAVKFFYYLLLILLIKSFPSPYLVITLLLATSLVSLIVTLFQLQKKLNLVYLLTKAKFSLNKRIFIESLSFSGIVFLSSIHTKIDIFMLSVLGNNTIVGVYSLPQKLIEQLLVVSGILSVSFFPVVLKNKDSFLKINSFKKLISFMTLFLIAYFFFVSLIQDYIVGIFLAHYGKEYNQSAGILIVLLYYLGLSFFLMPFSLLLQSFRKEKVILLIFLFMALLKILLNYILFDKYSLMGFAFTTLIVFIIGTLFIATYSLLYIKSKNRIE